MAELIRQGKCRRPLGYLEADCRSGVIAGGVFLPAWSSKYPNKKKDKDPNLHTCSKLNLFRSARSIIEARNSPASVRFSNRAKVSTFRTRFGPPFRFGGSLAGLSLASSSGIASIDEGEGIGKTQADFR